MVIEIIGYILAGCFPLVILWTMVILTIIMLKKR